MRWSEVVSGWQQVVNKEQCGDGRVVAIVGSIFGHISRYGIIFARVRFPFLCNSRLSPPSLRRLTPGREAGQRGGCEV
jgi:hypothetical protein